MIRSNNTVSSDRNLPTIMICSSSVILSMSGRSSLAGMISGDRMPKRDLASADINSSEGQISHLAGQSEKLRKRQDAHQPGKIPKELRKFTEVCKAVDDV